ncbi:polymorphic toxin-type HINT domain-containing protein, partial [Promicromonospora citrea]
AVAAIVSAVANITLAATGERSWAEAGIAIAGAALSLIGLGGAAKAAMGLSKTIAKAGGFRQALGKGWCKFGFGKCFVAGTLVHTPDGPRRIEEIRVGDKVWARDTVTGRDELALVAETFVRTSTELFHLTIGGQVVSTTAEHPFWVQGRGWVDAAFLRTGDLLVTPEGATLPLQDVQTEDRAEDQAETVYNFHVETHHTYYVYAGDTPVLVHNAAHSAPDGIPGLKFKPKDGAGRPTGVKVTLTPENIAKYGQRTDPPASVRSGLGAEYDGAKHNAGHILGAQLGGPNKNLDNFFIQHSTSNSPWQSAIESEVKRAVTGKIDGVPAGPVDYDVTLKYADDASTDIPPQVEIKATSDHYNLDVTLKNEPDMPNVRETPAFDRNADGLRFGEVGSGPATPRNAPS